jgi:hypothetical protein
VSVSSSAGGSELEEVWARASGAVRAVIESSTRLAESVVELRIAQLRRAAQQERELAQQAREQARAHRLADSVVWRAAMRPQWWREAGAEDIGRVWRAASTWQDVDARAAAARQVVVERLAERGVRVDAHAQTRPGPDDVAWLSDALDRAAAERSTAADNRERGASAAGPGGEAIVIEGEVGDPGQGSGRTGRRDRAAGDDRAAREERAAVQVRAVWSAERADRVIGCQAWGALAYQLAQLEEQGEDVAVLLYGVPDFVDRAHTPAAFAFRSIEERRDGQAEPVAEQAAEQALRGVGAERAAANGHRAEERDERAAQRHAEQVEVQPNGLGQVEADRAREQADLHADLAAMHEARAAQLAAQGFPTSTKAAVAGAAEKARGGVASAATKTAEHGAKRPVTAVQRTRREPKGR